MPELPEVETVVWECKPSVKKTVKIRIITELHKNDFILE